MRAKMNRRQFLQLSALGLAGVFLASCTTPAATTEPKTEAPTTAPGGEGPGKTVGKEAPQLAEMVKAGTLPPLEERLPVEPCVCVMDGYDQQIGIYGGNLASPRSINQCTRAQWLCLTQDATTLFPEIAKSWKYNDDGTVLTVTLREGTKWSDGEPFTTKDVMFWWQAYVLNDTLVPNKPNAWKVDGKLMDVVAVDDFTFELRFPGPYYYAHYGLSNVAQRGHQAAGTNAFFQPKHFMEKFHPDFNPDAEKLAKDAGYETWNAHFAYWATTQPLPPGVPTLQAWVMTEQTVTGNTWKRNPYYFKVDPEGNQLPYIDELLELPPADTKAASMQLVSGQVDFEAWGIGLPDYPVLKQNEATAEYEVWLGGDTWNAWSAYWINETFNADPELAKIFQDKRFRQALSLAINRNEINEKTLLGNGTPTQVTVWNKADYFVQEYADAFIEYDVARANALLDEMGLTKKDAEGFRTKLDGQPMTVIIDVVDDMPHWVPATELVKSYWDAVGVRTIVHLADRNLIWSQLSAGELQVFTWVMDGNHPFVLESSKSGNMRISWWAPQWWSWINTKGETGVEPPDEVKALNDLCEKIPGTPHDQIGDLMKQIWKYQADNLYAIGTVGYAGKPVYAKKKLGNVNKAAFADNHDTGGTRGYWMEAFYWKA